MSRLTAIDPAQATGETRELLDAAQQTLGRLPNFVRTLASSPAALKGVSACPCRRFSAFHAVWP